ncbi:hypothetical protein [Clostridium sp. JS66]|uniref:hypothetical protein n=1 Tax=Clostridium sp. JS66 TaxID=3064705 RepID=UPI00298E500C|nr:hypothetical protein [Clostridium sp. JS66]WPC39994.1 hypothetical protein Q6H37_19080 [Clostridium sp. JS66]
MRKIICSIFIVAALLVCSMSLTSCKAITAQNITNTGSGQGMNGNRMSNADLIGKIVSVDANTIKLKIAKQNSNGNKNVNGTSSTKGNAASDMNGNQNANVTPNMNDNQASKGMPNTNGILNGNGNQNNNNDNRKPPQGGFPGGKLELSYTGETKTITVNSDVKILERTGIPGRNGNDSSKLSTKISDLKKGQVIMIWYKQNTKTVERISLMQ